MKEPDQKKTALKPGKKENKDEKKKLAVKPATINAKQFIERLKAHQSDAELKKIQRYFKSGEGQYGEGDQFMGVKMGQLFTLAKEFNGMAIGEIEKLLESPVHEVRAGAISIMDKESRNKNITADRLKEFYELYMRRHDRVNNWDLVDLGCLYMTGSYLFDKSHAILYKLAKSKNIWERRTAILSTCYFIRKGDTSDTFKIAEILVNDKEDLIHKATGWILRFAGDKEPKKLLIFLDKYAATMPRTLLRYSIEKLNKKQKEYYMGLKKESKN
jgi:3-methyladenine DNA glycosylase AlkD